MTFKTHRRAVPRAVSALVAAAVATTGMVTLPVVTLAGISSATAAPASTGISVEAQTTNGRVNPLGITTAAPTFGWTSTAAGRDVAQSAYEIQVGTTAGADDVWSSGKVSSNEQTDIDYQGPALISATRYYWRVRVWDGNGSASDWSDSAWYETGLQNASDWGSAAWVGRPAATYSNWTNYTATIDFHLNAVAFGTYLRASDVNNAYMWQLNVGDTTSSVPLLRPHVKKNGTYTLLGEIDLRPFGFTRASLLTGTHHLRFELSGATVKTYLDDLLVDTRTNSTFTAGRIGIRTYGSESVNISGVKVVAADSTVLANPALASTNPLNGGALSNGQLVVSGSTDALFSGQESYEPLLRRSFTLDPDKTVKSARVYASAHGVYQLQLNGKRVGDEYLAPGYTEYDKRIQSQTYDVTDLVKSGSNAIGAEMGDGWWAGKVGLAGKGQYGTDLALIARMKVTYTDGSIDWVDTDDHWTWSAGPFVATDNQLGETYNANFEQAGWDTASFDDASWSPVVARSSDTAKLSPQPDEPVRQTGTVTTKNVTTPTSGVNVYDLGQNMVGVARVTITGKAGETVKIRHAEMLNPNGTIYTENLRAALATDYYTFAADGTITYQPTFTQHGFRYIEISGSSTLPPADDVEGIVLGSDLANTGSLSTSDTMLNQLESNVRWGARGNFLSIPTDTPARDERLGWTGDINVFSPTASYLFDMRAFLDKWMQDVRDEQTTDGQIPAVVPSTKGAFQDSGPGWEDAIVAVPYALYQAYGDLSLVKENWSAMQRFYDFAAAKIGSDNLGSYNDTFFTTTDWLSLDNSSGTSNDVKTTAIWADTVRMMAELATAMGDPRATEFTTRFAQIKQDFVAAYVKSDGTIVGGAQTVYAMALGMNLIDDPALKDQVGAKYVANLAKSDNHLQTGFIGTPWLLPALSNIGRLDIAYDLLLKKDYPSWGYEISKGATTVWERWNSLQPDGSFGPVDMNSFNHYAYGAVLNWMHQNIGGIAIKEPGYRKSLIAPQPGGGITHADDSITTVYGKLSDTWATTDDGITMNVTVPVNTTSEIHIPATSLWSVTESGRLLSKAEGVRDLTYDAEAREAVVTVGSGTYQFAASTELDSTAAIHDALDAFASTVGGLDLGSSDAAQLDQAQRDATANIETALAALVDGDKATATTALGHARSTLSALKAWLATSGIDTDTSAPLQTRLSSIERQLASRILSLVGISVSLPALDAVSVPGATVHGTVTVTNSSSAPITAVGATVTVPGLTTALHLSNGVLAAGATAQLPFDVAISPTTKQGSYQAGLDVSVTTAEGTFEFTQTTATWLRVEKKLAITDATVTTPQAGLATIAVGLSNSGSSAISGRVVASVPTGWTQPAPSPTVTVAPGSSTTNLAVYPPLAATPGTYPVTLTFVDRGITLSSYTTQVTVAALNLPPTEPTADYVDFGASASETAHHVLASATSGTSSEAGYTRRYSHNNTPGSWYSADVAVTPGKPFLLRMRETWNTAGTKDYNVYVDGTLVQRVTYSRTASGQGVTSYQLLVDNPTVLDNDGTVTVKFEYPTTDAALQYYDPSIADLWTIPQADTISPSVSADLGDDPAYGNNGWLRGSATVTITAADDRTAAPAVEYSLGDGWKAYTGPVVIDEDGDHALKYRATDVAGNVSPVSTIAVPIDVTPPTVTLAGGPQGDVSYGTVPSSPVCSSSDAVSGVLSCDVTGYATTVGQHTVTATAQDSAGNVSSVARTYTVTKADQSIAIEAPESAAFGDKEVTVTASASSGLPVTLAVTGACELDGSTLRMTGSGNCTLAGSQAGDDNYNAASATRSISIARAGQSIILKAPSSKRYGNADFVITATSSVGLPVSVTSSGACTNLGTRIHLVGAGTCRIVATQTGNANVNPAADNVAIISVAKATLTKALVTLTGKARAGKRLAVHVTVSPAAAASYRWFRNGKLIKNARKATYRLTRKDRGRKVWSQVTLTRSNYVTVVKTTKKVKVRR
jgi:alpha-L-rhamnosidase